MNFISRTITGAIFILIGFSLIVMGFFKGYFVLIYGFPFFILGLVIFFNKNEDKIEKVKDNNLKKMKGGRK